MAWETSAPQWQLPEDEVHVWHVPFDEPPEERTVKLVSLLSPRERERAARFYRRREQNRFLVSRATLRRILGHYQDVAPSSLRIALNAHGKPELDGSEMLSFNLSHSGNLALIAVTRNRALGVDVEQLRTGVDVERLAARFFSPAEARQLASLAGPEEQVEAFFRCWTRKEAYIKGQGVGLSLGLQSFDVTLAPGQSARIVATRPDAAEAGDWQLRDLQPAPGYAAALAVKGWDWTLRCWTWVEATMG
jgi:4'-phosphopantetheinyl transferase